MCGRYVITTPLEAIREAFGIAADDVVRPDAAARYNVAPTQEVPIVRRRADGTSRELALARWGLVPHWAKEPSIGNRLINARGDSVATKPAFRDAFARRRCLVVADGFYEWRKDPGGKQPFVFRPADGRPLAFAGLWSLWRPSDGEPLHTCTIITTDANATVAPVHDRMPAILEPQDHDAWLAAPAAEALPLIRPLAADRLVGTPISRRVNNVRNDGPQLIEPLARQPSLL